MKKAYPPQAARRRLLLPCLLALLLLPLLTPAQPAMQCLVVPAPPSQTAPRPDPVDPAEAPCAEVQNIRVNFHFVQHDDGTGNFGAFDDGRPGNPDPAHSGYDYVRDLMYALNGGMDSNPPLNLAPGSSLTPIAKRVRWVLDGVFFDKNSTYRDGAGATTATMRDYSSLCVRADSVINIFLVEEIEWPYSGPRSITTAGQPAVSSPLAQRGYVTRNNQANCDTDPAPAQLWAVVGSPWTNYVLFNQAAWQFAGTVNHELCHLLGLNHPFQYNGYSWGECPEAPMNANCWNLNPSDPNCATQAQVSNNLMDYNTFKTSLAPCQIGIIQHNLNTCLRRRYVYKCSNCLPASATFEVTVGAGCLPVPIWLDSRATGSYDWYKLEVDQVTATNRLVSGTHYETTQYGQVLGRTQLDQVYAFEGNRRYRVKLTTHNYCTSSAAAVRVRYLETPTCTLLPGGQRSAAPTTNVPSTPIFK